MTREVRVNVIFLICLAVLMTPGFCFLMYRKLNGGGGRSNSRPDPVASAITYMQPLPAPPVPRREPRLVREWVDNLIESRLGPGVAAFRVATADDDAIPLVSDRFITQFVATTPGKEPGTTRVTLIVWENAPDLQANPPEVTIVTAGGPTAITTTVKAKPPEIIDMPKNVRHALQDTGYVDPPARIAWFDVSVPMVISGPLDKITVARQVANRAVTETITFPPNTPNATTKPTQ